MWVANHEKRGKIACRVSRRAFCIKNSIFLWFWTVYINIKNPDHHYLLYPMVKVLFITDKAKYSRKLLFLNLFLDHHCLLYPMLQAVFFTDEAKYSRKLHFFYLFLGHHCLLYPMIQALFFTDEAKYSRKLHFLFITIVSSVCVCGCVCGCVYV